MIIILGTPGAGKTTQTRLLAEYLNCKWFSMGELIRQKVTGQDRQDMLAGKIISDDTTLSILDTTLAPINTTKEEVVFEGNPRSVTQAQWWLEQIKNGRFNVRAIIHLVADLKVAEARLVKRGRLDDHDDGVIAKRFNEYENSIIPTLNYLKQNGLTVHEISANGSIEEIAGAMHRALGV